MYLCVKPRCCDCVFEHAPSLPVDVGRVVDGDVDVALKGFQGLAKHFGGKTSPDLLTLSSCIDL